METQLKSHSPMWKEKKIDYINLQKGILETVYENWILLVGKGMTT